MELELSFPFRDRASGGILSLFFTPLGPLNFFCFLTLGKVPPHDGVPEWSKSQTDEGTHLLVSSFGATTCGITWHNSLMNEMLDFEVDLKL
ncbi:hypothetical protein CFP56_042953 [Quercus suber]|uniref:Uncharacterized protein n=1 Tax=Quercus suber TaxID=58331 RepID=A0AAW0LJJ3_QUESU